jgi:hypothetical protein
MRSGVVQCSGLANVTGNMRVQRIAHLYCSMHHHHVMQECATGLCCVVYIDAHCFCRQVAGITGLTARLAIKWRAVEYNHPFFAFAQFSHMLSTA